jgi:hypothetical protein
LSKPELDAQQTLKLVYKDLLGMIKKTLQDPKFKDNLHYDAVVDRYNTLWSYFCDTLHLHPGFKTDVGCCRLDPNDSNSPRVFSDMHTGIWIQRAHMLVRPGRTPLGLVIYSDKTHAFQNMQVYPLYCEYSVSQKPE